MTWEVLIRKARVRLREAKSHGDIVERAVVETAADEWCDVERETLLLLQELAFGLGDLHSACEELLTGLDALAIAMHGYMAEEEPKGG